MARNAIRPKKAVAKASPVSLKSPYGAPWLQGVNAAGGDADAAI